MTVKEYKDSTKGGGKKALFHPQFLQRPNIEQKKVQEFVKKFADAVRKADVDMKGGAGDLPVYRAATQIVDCQTVPGFANGKEVPGVGLLLSDRLPHSTKKI